MKAIVVREPGAPSVLSMEIVADPVPGPRQVVVAVEHCGVCFHDVVVRRGTLKAGIAMPLILGHEIGGRIAAVGREVRGISVGERVATTQRAHVCGWCRYCRGGREPLCAEMEFLGDAGLNGGYADFVALDADNVVPVPDAVELRDASIAACAIGTAFHAVVGVGRAGPGDRVLITGASGGVGLHAVQIAHAAGAVVIAASTSPHRAAALRDAGADHLVTHGRGEDFSAEVRDLCGGADVVIDTVGTPVFGPTRRSIARGGKWVMVGQLNGDFVPFNPAQLFLKGIDMLSSTSVTREELRQCLQLMAAGSVRATIDTTLPLAEAGEAHRRLEAGTPLGRITLAPPLASRAA